MTPRASRLVWLTLFVGAGLAGCSNSKGLVPVEGRVRFSGGQPPVAGMLFFVPREMSTNLARDRTGPLPGTGLFLTDGSFQAGTFVLGDGLRPGTYEVRIECAAEEAATGVDPHHAPRQSYVPEAFRPPDLVVPASGPRPVRYDLDVR